MKFSKLYLQILALGFAIAGFSFVQAQTFDGHTFIQARHIMRNQINTFNNHISKKLQNLSIQAYRADKTRNQFKMVVGENLSSAWAEKSRHIKKLMNTSLQKVDTMIPDTYVSTKKDIAHKQQTINKLMGQLTDVHRNMEKLVHDT